MLGKYYKTQKRDMSTGETVFELAVLEPCPFSKDGILLCHGKIDVFAYGIPLEVEGCYKNQMFEISNYRFMPQTDNGIRAMLEYLYEDFTEAQLNKFVKFCEHDIFTLIKKPVIFNEVLKRTKKKEQIKEYVLNKLNALNEQKEFTDALMKYNVEINKIEAMYEKGIQYSDFKRSPYTYSLFHDISIYQADQFAYDMCCILPYSRKRLCGFVLNAALSYKKAGHSCVKIDNLLDCVNMQMKKSVYPEDSVSLSMINCVITFMSKYMSVYVIDNEVYVYFNETWKEELSIVDNLNRLQRTRRELIANPNVRKIESSLSFHYNEKQRTAFRLLETSGVKILTGPPGSGKTAILKGFVQIYKETFPGKKIKLAATTGRAAQVMSEATGLPSETINKMLDIRPYNGNLQGKDLNNPVDAEFVVCDEISMLGLNLASFLLQAIKNGTLLILVGDEDQLQSVEYGNVLQDFIRSGKIEVCRLTEIMRYSGSIIENSKKINQGVTTLKSDPNFRIHRASGDELLSMLVKNIQDRDVQVISPVKKGVLGINNINMVIQKYKNPKKELCIKYRHVEYYKNDPIIMTETNYEKGYFNGDIGTILEGDENGLSVKFDDKCIRLEKEDFHNINLAYCITVHKSQGSGFDHIHIVLPRHPDNMLTRRILYTAVTRAKKDVHIYCEEDSLEYAISNHSERPRLSLLCYKMSKQC